MSVEAISGKAEPSLSQPDLYSTYIQTEISNHYYEYKHIAVPTLNKVSAFARAAEGATVFCRMRCCVSIAMSSRIARLYRGVGGSATAASLPSVHSYGTHRGG